MGVLFSRAAFPAAVFDRMPSSVCRSGSGFALASYAELCGEIRLALRLMLAVSKTLAVQSPRDFLPSLAHHWSCRLRAYRYSFRAPLHVPEPIAGGSPAASYPHPKDPQHHTRTMFCSCSPTAKEAAPVPPPPRPPVPSEAQRIAAALAGVPYSDAASTPVAVKSSVVDVECLGVGESTPAAAPREARHTPAAPAPRTPHLDDPLSFEEYGDHHTDDRRGELVL